ncbi:MAG: glycosyltransferase family 4 protein [Candidatus Aminicenantes bacterium]|nr:glycosyltransferase family 4 protein [Candidatus Aminicenantes bacterium]
MRIGFDVRPFLREETGIGMFFKNLLIELARIDTQNEYFLFSSSWKDRFLPSRIPSFKRGYFRDFRIPVRILNHLWYRFKWPPLDFFFGEKLDLTHSPTPLLLPGRGKKVITICDLFFLEPSHLADKEAVRYFAPGLKNSLLKADGIVTISHYTKDRILEKFSVDDKKIRVIHLGLDGKNRSDIPPEKLALVRKKWNLPQNFLFFVGAVERRKNLINLMAALNSIRSSGFFLPLVIAGKKGGDTANVLSYIRDNNLENDVRILGYVPEEDLPALYKAASVFVFPSLCEGFGLPVLEAMAAGKPAAVSREGAVPEVAGEAAVYFDPGDPRDIADKILNILKEPGLRDKLAAAGPKKAREYRWTITAEETLAFYGWVLEQ